MNYCLIFKRIESQEKNLLTSQNHFVLPQSNLKVILQFSLPVDGPNGEDLIAEVVVSGKRKDAVVACALEACRMLDKFGLLRSSTHGKILMFFGCFYFGLYL